MTDSQKNQARRAAIAERAIKEARGALGSDDDEGAGELKKPKKKKSGLTLKRTEKELAAGVAEGNAEEGEEEEMSDLGAEIGSAVSKAERRSAAGKKRTRKVQETSINHLDEMLANRSLAKERRLTLEANERAEDRKLVSDRLELDRQRMNPEQERLAEQRLDAAAQRQQTAESHHLMMQFKMTLQKRVNKGILIVHVYLTTNSALAIVDIFQQSRRR